MWLDRDFRDCDCVLGCRIVADTVDKGTTAHLHPDRFTEGVVCAGQERGAKLHLGEATGLVLNRDGTRVEGMAIEGRRSLAMEPSSPWDPDSALTHGASLCP